MNAESVISFLIMIGEKIEKVEGALVAAKVKYDAALNEIERLVIKHKE